MLRAFILKIVNLVNPWTTVRKLRRWNKRNQSWLIPAVLAFQQSLAEAQQDQTNLRVHGKNYARLRKECFDCGKKKEDRESAIRTCEAISDSIQRIRNSYHGIDLESETGVLQAACVLFNEKLIRLAPMALDRYECGVAEAVHEIIAGITLNKDERNW